MGQHGEHRPLVIRAPLIAAAVLAAAPAEACRLALALALDISSSVDEYEDILQRTGLAAALIAPEVQSAILASADPIAIAAFEWSGRYNQELLVNWTLITDAETLTNVAAAIGRSDRSFNEFPTALGHALEFGRDLMKTAPDCLFQTIDMAGDGASNEGPDPLVIYAQGGFEAITVNGMVVNAADYEAEVDLIPYYQNNVLYGPSAFLEVAQGFEDYERAMRRKLERETRPRTIGGLQSPLVPKG